MPTRWRFPVKSSPPRTVVLSAQDSESLSHLFATNQRARRMSYLAYVSPTSSEKRYQLQPARVRLLMLGFGLPLFGVTPLIIGISLWWLTGIHQLVALILAGVFLLAGLVLIQQVRRWAIDTYLILTTEGLLYHTQTITIQTAWANIAQIHERGNYPADRPTSSCCHGDECLEHAPTPARYPGRSSDPAGGLWL